METGGGKYARPYVIAEVDAAAFDAVHCVDLIKTSKDSIVSRTNALKGFLDPFLEAFWNYVDSHDVLTDKGRYKIIITFEPEE